MRIKYALSNGLKVQEPQIRFHEYKDIWQYIKIGDLIRTITDYVAAGSFADIAKNVNYLSDVGFAQLVRTVDFKNKFKNKNFVYVDQNAFEYLWRVNLQDDCIILPNIGANIGEVYFSTQSLLPHTNNVLGPNAILLKDYNNLKFIYNYFQTYKFQKQLSIIIASSGQPKFNKTELKGIKLAIPSIDEQNKITAFLDLIDQKIEKQELLIENLKKYKRGLIKQCFSLNEDYYPHLRFSCYNTQWIPIKLGNYLKFYSGLTYSPNDITDNSGTLVLRSSNIQNNKIENADNVYVNDKKVNVDNVEIGDIIVVVRNGSRNLIGKHAQIKTKMEKTVIGAFMTGIRSSTPNFTMALLDSDRFSEEIHKNLGATINQITTGIFKNMIFYMPISLEEKEKIGLLFNKVDNLITWHEKKLSLLQKQKKAFLQQLFI